MILERPWEAITRDNVTLRVDAVVYYRVVDPIKAIINVQNYKFAVSQVAQTSLRSVIGQSDMDHILSEREKINAHLKDVIDAPTEQPWGIRVERVEIKDVALPESMKRSMSGRPKPNANAAPGSSPPMANTRHPRSSPRPPPSWPPTRPPCSCGCCKPSSRSPPRRTAPWSMPVPVELLRFFDRERPGHRPSPAPRRPGHRPLAARPRNTRPHNPSKPASQRRRDRAAQRRPQNTSRRLNDATPVPPQPSAAGNRQPRVAGTAVNRHCPDRTSAPFGVMFMMQAGKLAAGPRPCLAAEAGRRPWSAWI